MVRCWPLLSITEDNDAGFSTNNWLEQCDSAGFHLVLTYFYVLTEGEEEAAVKAELSEETGLVEEDLVSVSYMGDELDLETVGDIIAIIEEKVCTVFIC